MRYLVFDAEIRKCIPDREKLNDPRYEYCAGWDDYTNMGISFLGAYVSWLDKICYFDENSLGTFVELISEADLVSGFNLFGFDIELLKATLVRNGLPEKTGLAGKVYDVFADIKKSVKGSVKGWNLDNTVHHNLGLRKSGDGAMAPILWQEGRYADLINYLRTYVEIETRLFRHCCDRRALKNPDALIPEVELEQIDKIAEKWTDFRTTEP